MRLNKPLFPKPTTDEMKRAFRALGHGNPPAQTPRELLRIAGRWLTDYAMMNAGAAFDGDMEGLAYSPEVTAIWTAFQYFGLPTYRPDYVEWLQHYEFGALQSGSMLSGADSDVLQLYLQAAHRSEKWSPGSWAFFVHDGGLMAAASNLLQLLDEGKWEAPWS